MDDIWFDVYVDSKYLGTVPNEHKYKFIELFGYDSESYPKIEFKLSIKS